MFSEENQAVAMKHESQLLFRIHFLLVIFQRFSTTIVTADFPAIFHDYRDSQPFVKQPRASVMLAIRRLILATV
jgi:hypothetical protein